MRNNHVELFTLKIGKARRQLEGRNDFLTVSKCYGRLNFSAISLLRAQPPKSRESIIAFKGLIAGKSISGDFATRFFETFAI